MKSNNAPEKIIKKNDELKSAKVEVVTIFTKDETENSSNDDVNDADVGIDDGDEQDRIIRFR